jgi:hypothetical protein
VSHKEQANMQAQIQIENSGKRITSARARFGKKPNEIVSVVIPPGSKTLTFNMADAQDAAKFKALSALLTDTKGPMARRTMGKKSFLSVVVVGGEPESAPAPDAKQGAHKAGR